MHEKENDHCLSPDLKNTFNNYYNHYRNVYFRTIVARITNEEAKHDSFNLVIPLGLSHIFIL